MKKRSERIGDGDKRAMPQKETWLWRSTNYWRHGAGRYEEPQSRIMAKDDVNGGKGMVMYRTNIKSGTKKSMMMKDGWMTGP
jgi:hypothetical protein